MLPKEIEKLRSLTSFDALVEFLRDELDWPIDPEDASEITFDYEAKELGIDPIHAVKIEKIRQIRPLADNQPWGIFYIEFESKRLPVVVLRRILRSLVPTSRRQDPHQPAWRMSDLLFISSQGESGNRSISFAHFHQRDGELPELRTFSWDSRESHFYYIRNLNLEALRWPADESDTAAWREQWNKAFTIKHRYVPTTSQMLAREMAYLASTIRELVLDIYNLEHSGGPLHQLHLSFKMTLISDLSIDDFADMYAQTITYGLFSARATHQEDFAVEDVVVMVPNTNPFLRELLEELTFQRVVDLDELGVGQLARLLKEVNMEAILQDFGRQRQGEDPVIHFYETFLYHYDADKKIQRGVFYTPDPVVSFIINSVNYLLQTRFDLYDGLADVGTVEHKGKTLPKVQILDPATGTGTFLKYVIQIIWNNFNKRIGHTKDLESKENWNSYVAEYLLPRLNGFELMMAPYTIAHMKLGLTLRETGYEFGANERLRIYLTNALQPAHEIPRLDTPALAHEAKEANRIKLETPIMVVIGNPPYSGHSSNKGKWITQLIRDYYRVDGKPLGEQNPKYLLDDYVKFLRYGQYVIDRNGSGILAFISNNGYLDNPTFRGMRQQLLKTFSEIYVLDLHGSLKKKERSPDGSKDENVFDIQQGVAICFMIKTEDRQEYARVYHSDLYGLRSSKYDFLISNMIKDTDWEKVTPQSPYYLFKPQDEELLRKYKKYWSIVEIMPETSTGVKTHRDHFAVAFNEEEIVRRVTDFRTLSVSDDVIREKYSLNNTRDWKLSNRRKSFSNVSNWRSHVEEYLYRPFDYRKIYYHHDLLELPRLEIMQHLIKNENLAIGIGRQGIAVSESIWDLQICTNVPIDTNVFRRGGIQVFPLYLYTFAETSLQSRMFRRLPERDMSRMTNLNPTFVSELESTIGLKYINDGHGDLTTTFGPKDVFHYIYSVFYSPTYRYTYEEFLEIDFPRLPLTSNAHLFRHLCNLGADMVALHILKDDYDLSSWTRDGKPSPLLSPIIKFVEGDNGTTVGHFSKSKCYEDEKVYIDTSLGKRGSYFAGIPEDVWSFHIGGYQVLYKWLYDRRETPSQPGRTLTQEDIEHYQRIVVALKETIRLMSEIDEVIEEHGGWPIQ